jgi:hypothetical protein
VAGRRVPERLLEPAAHDQILRHRFRGSAGLADHVHQYAAGIDPRERGGDRGGVHVLQHGEPGEELPALVVELVPGGRSQRAEQRARPQGGASDPEHEHMVVGLAQSFRECRDLAHGRVLVDEVVEPVFAGRAAGAHLVLDCRKPAGELLEPGSGQAVLPVEAVLQQASVRQANHATSTVSPS